MQWLSGCPAGLWMETSGSKPWPASFEARYYTPTVPLTTLDDTKALATNHEIDLQAQQYVTLAWRETGVIRMLTEKASKFLR